MADLEPIPVGRRRTWLDDADRDRRLVRRILGPWIITFHGLTSACGDPADIEVPLPFVSVNPPSIISTSSAVLMVEGNGSDIRCAAFRVELPADARLTLRHAVGARLSSHGSSSVECLVQARDRNAPNDFDIELRLSDPMLPHFEMSGHFVAGQEAMLRVGMQLPESGAMQFDCAGEARTVLPGAAWFPSFSCESARYDDVPVSCRLEGGVIVEKCE